MLTDFILPDIVADEEILYRAICPRFWISRLEKFSTAVYKQSTGVSVDRQGNREEQNIIDDYSTRFSNYGLLNISALDCRISETEPISKPSKRNKYHAEIVNDDGNINIPPNKCDKLRQCSNVIFAPRIT